jgi:tetratricopeptide (TPR) repeat protein
VLQQQGEEATAVEWLEQVLAKSKDDFDLRLIYARLLADLKRYDDARKQFTILLKAQPDNGDVLYTLGLLSLQSSRVDEAESYLNRLTARPDGTADQARYYLGQIAESRNQTDQALVHYRSLRASAEGSDNYFDAQLRIAFLLSKSDRLNDARAQLHGVRPRHEQDAVQLILAEGEILAEHGGNDDAMAVYDTALDGGYNRDLLYARAMLAAKVDRLDILEGDLRNIIDREPDAVEALNALGYTLADRTDRLQEAYDLVARALQIDNSKFHILDSMGWVLYRMGRLQEAIDYLKKARTLRDDPEVAAHLGEVLWVTGDRDAARDVFDSALKSTPGDQKLLEVIERLRK